MLPRDACAKGGPKPGPRRKIRWLECAGLNGCGVRRDPLSRKSRIREGCAIRTRPLLWAAVLGTVRRLWSCWRPAVLTRACVRAVESHAPDRAPSAGRRQPVCPLCVLRPGGGSESGAGSEPQEAGADGTGRARRGGAESGLAGEIGRRIGGACASVYPRSESGA